MTADPSRAPDRSPAWFVVTAQCVILAGPFEREETAGIAYDDVVTKLRHDLERTWYVRRHPRTRGARSRR